jgi:hypothetical protein
MMLLIMLVMMVMAGVLCISVVTGLHLGGDHDRPIVGSICGLVIGLLLAWAVLGVSKAWLRGALEKQLAEEADRVTYGGIDRIKGRHCDVDQAIAKAMRDGRMSVGESILIHRIENDHAMKEARSRLSGVRPSETCATAPSSAPIPSKETTR